MATKKKPTAPEAAVEAYEKLIAMHPKIERKGATLPYTSHNGHMFTYLSKEGELGIRLPEEEREAFLKKYNTTLLKQHGAVMREYVKVPKNMMTKTATLKKYLEVSFDYVSSLKPKPTN